GARHLAAAAAPAGARGDTPAVTSLLARAVALLPPGDEERAALLPQLADARRFAGDFDGAATAIDEALAARDERVRLWAQLARARLRLRSGVDLDAAALEAETREAIAALERLGDER